MADNDLKRKFDKHFGKGYYETILKAGIVVGIPKERLARELNTSVLEVDALIEKYRQEISDISIHKEIAAQIMEPLARVRLSRIQMMILDRLHRMIAEEDSDLKPNILVDLFKFTTKYLNSFDETHKRDLTEIPEKDLKDRIKALTEGIEKAS